MSKENVKESLQQTAQEPGQPWGRTAQELKAYVKTYQLSNGMCVVLLQDNSFPAVFLSSGWRMGSANETSDTRGFASLLKYMSFKGGNKISQEQVQELLAEHKATVFMFNLSDTVTYTMQVPKAQYQSLLSVLIDRSQNLTFKEQDLTFAIEQMVIERKKHKKQFIVTLLEETAKAVFPENHRYHKPVLGYTQTLSSITLGEIQKFYDTRSEPQNCTFFVVGDFQEKEVLEQLKTELGCEVKECPIEAIKSHEESDNQFFTQADSSKEVICHKKGGNPFVILAWRIFGGTKDIKDWIVLGMIGNRLKDILKICLEEEENIADSVLIKIREDLYHETTFSISFSCQEKDIDRAIEIIQAQVAQEIDEGFLTQDELEEVQEESIKAFRQSTLSSLFALGMKLTFHTAPGNADPKILFDREEIIKNVSIDDLRALGQKYFGNKWDAKITILPLDDLSTPGFLAEQKRENLLAEEILSNHPVVTPTTNKTLG